MRFPVNNVWSFKYFSYVYDSSIEAQLNEFQDLKFLSAPT